MFPPERIGPFELHGLLGHGSAGQVYAAVDTRRGERVALKLLPPSLLEGPLGGERRARFLEEGRLAAALNHPGLVRILDYGSADGLPYLVMEYVHGRSLREVMNLRIPMPLAVLGDMALNILNPLAHLHGAGMVHRDLKPGNLLVFPPWRVKIADFGLARFRDTVSTHGRFRVSGTPGYMAPEQLMGLEADPRTDLFAVGVILYELLTGVRPFQGEREGVEGVLYQDAPPPSRHAPGLPPAWDALLARALARRPGDRFPSAQAFAVALVETLHPDTPLGEERP